MEAAIQGAAPDNNEGQHIRQLLQSQLDIAWQLLEYHLHDLDDDEGLWQPATAGLHVRKQEGGGWRADWPQSEAYDIGPASIAWLTWHIIFWWSMTLDHSFGNASLTREAVQWPGSIALAKAKIASLRDEWNTAIESLTDEQLLQAERTRWPFANKPFYELAGWLNLELMKNASEIGYCRFLYGSSVQKSF